jgi:1-deoxy-D-xylulose-5-phosphate reductoisomerase
MTATPKRVVLLGATGSIGQQALEVIAAHPDTFTLVGASAHRQVDALTDLVHRFNVPTVAIADTAHTHTLKSNTTATVIDGPHAATELAAIDCDLVLNGITGAIGLAPTLAALHAGTPVALANKESLVAAGDLVVAAAEKAGGREHALIPVDSEHSALAQALRGGRRDEVDVLTLTASGGPFRGRTRAELAHVGVADALKHPTWTMGQMVTINSATMMNKGLEVIEAHHLFAVDYSQIGVVVHPESVVHSLVQFVDGSTLAQLSPPDMRLPIQLALSWPDRLAHAFVACDFTTAQTLTFEPVDLDVFRALDLAITAGRRGGGHPLVLNAANEEAVMAFVSGTLPFLGIADVVEDTLALYAATNPGPLRDVDDVTELDGWARRTAADVLAKRGDV